MNFNGMKNNNTVKNRYNYKSANLTENFGETIKSKNQQLLILIFKAYQTPKQGRFVRNILNDLTNGQPSDFQKPKQKYKPSPKFSIFDDEETPQRNTKGLSPNISPIRKTKESIDLSLTTLLQDEDSKIRKQRRRQKLLIEPTAEEDEPDDALEDLKSIILWENANLTGVIFLSGLLFFTLIHFDYSPLTTLLNVGIASIAIGSLYTTFSSVYNRLSNIINTTERRDDPFQEEYEVEIDPKRFSKIAKFAAISFNDSIKFFRKLVAGEELLSSILGLMLLGILSHLTLKFGWNIVSMLIWLFIFTYPLITSPEYIQIAHSFVFGSLWSIFGVLQAVGNKIVYKLSK